MADKVKDFTKTPRNYEGVSLESYRKRVDSDFNQAHDELSDSYYNFWKKGLSKPWKGFDVQPTLAENKTLFDKLHSLLWAKHTLALEQEHDSALVKEEKFDLTMPKSIASANKVIEDADKEGVTFEI